MAVALLTIICACQPEPTPFPVDIPTPPTQAPPIEAATKPLRYALASDTRDSGYERILSQSGAQVVYLNMPIDAQSLGADHDVIVALGSYTDASISPLRLRAGLILNTGLAPLDNPALTAVIRRTLQPQRIAALIDTPGITALASDALSEAEFSPANLRAELANAGWPDGVDLQMAYASLFTVESIRLALADFNITLRAQPLTLPASSAHLTLVTWTDSPPPRTEQTELIPLVEAVISYWAMPDLIVTFSPDGWPVAARP